MSTPPAIPTVMLSNGVEMPQLALGTAPLSGQPGQSVESTNPRFIGLFPERVYRSVQLALTAGIRHIDTALIYRSQPAIAQVLGTWFTEGKLKREEVFITSKIYHPPAPGYGMDDTTLDMDALSVEEIAPKVHEHFQRALQELRVGYVDLMLLHWPSPGGGIGGGADGVAKIDPVKRAKRIVAWKVLEHYYSIGWARAIGVSNWTEVHMQQLMEDGATIQPQVNQVETSIYIREQGIIDYCKEKNTVVMAYSPFGRGVMDIDKDPVVTSIAEKHKVSPGHVALAFIIQSGFTGAATFYSSSEERIKSNIGIFSLKLDEEDIQELAKLKRPAGSWGLPSPYTLG